MFKSVLPLIHIVITFTVCSKKSVVAGTFTGPQLELYEAVLEVQKSCLNMCTPGVSLDALYREMCLMTGEKLKQLRVISRDLNGNSLLKVRDMEV